MILLGIPLAILALWLTAAGYLAWRLGLDFRQALTYAPLKLAFRISDRQVRIARESPGPVIYVVVHQSRLDPALMLSLLPDQTLHILDEHSATTTWLEPWRELARTIPFNAEHIFVSRRLVRHLRGKGRLAVYMPDLAEPDAKSFRLYRAVARIAVAAEARIVPIIVDGARDFSLSLAGPMESSRRWLPKLSITALAPHTIGELAARSTEPSPSASTLFDRIAEARLAAASLERSLFKAVRKAARHFGRDRVAVEGDRVAVDGGRLTYRQLFTEARLLGLSLAAKSAPGETIGLLLPNSPAMATAFLGLLSAGRPAAMLDSAASAASVTAAVRGAMIRTVLSSHNFVAESGLADIVAAAEAGGARLLWLEDIKAGWLDRQFARLLARQPIARTDGDTPALAVGDRLLSHRNLHANAMQLAARLDLSRQDSLTSLLPPSHPFALVPGLILPLLTGVRALLHPAAATTAGTQPTVRVATGSDRVAATSTVESDLRLSITFNRTESVEQFGRPGARVLDGFGLPEAGAVVTLNTAAQGREGSVGRLLPGMRARIEPVDGIADGGRLWIAGPNLATPAGRPGAAKDGWHDTGLIVAFDREGFLFVRGRAARIASVGGEIVSLDAIEALAATLWPEGRHAAVAVPDRRKGERVVLVTTAAAAKTADFKRSAKGSGTAAGDILVVDELPTLADGQTDNEAVRRLAAERPGRKRAA